MKDLNKLAKEVYEANKSKGFHDTEQSDETLLMLVITELSEAVEADRKGKRANVPLFNAFDTDNEYEQKKHQNRWERPSHDVFSFQSCIKDTIEDELADAVIRLLDLAGLRGLDIDRILVEEPKLNKSFPENIFQITSEIAYYKWSMSERISFAILNIFYLCDKMDIDIWKHVELKLEYNKMRGHKHGKLY